MADQFLGSHVEVRAAERAACARRALEILQGPRREVVDDIDGMTVLQQAIDEVRPDESGTAGDERVDVRSPESPC